MPRRLGVVLERLGDVLGEVWRHVGVSGSVTGSYSHILEVSKSFFSVFLRCRGVLEAAWRQFGSVVEAFWKRPGASTKRFFRS